MKTFRHLLILATATLSANAATIQFFSNSTAAAPSENNSVGSNVVIAKNPAWTNPIAGSQWISYASTGDPSAAGFTSPANGTVVSFFQNFILSAAGPLQEWNRFALRRRFLVRGSHGITLLSEASSAGNTYGTCLRYDSELHRANHRYIAFGRLCRR